jgi:hypothetical protein
VKQIIGAPAVLLAVTLAAGCATRQMATIEPTSGDGPGAGAARGAGAASDDRGFVLSRSRPTVPRAGEGVEIHIGDRWWPYRADYLRIDDVEVRSHDADISEVQAPESFWDEQVASEALSVWTAVCNECHGGRRRLEDAVKMPFPPAQWGRGEGFFFGARRRYADVFMTIYRGGPERNGVRSEMPAWRGKIAKELIWALLYFLEYQSGGIEGRFPPSLYPRGDSVVPP